MVDKGPDGCSRSSPCSLCEGDCDKDTDCEGSLKCFQRKKETDIVPGCASSGYVRTSGSDHDYCYNPSEGTLNHRSFSFFSERLVRSSYLTTMLSI